MFLIQFISIVATERCLRHCLALDSVGERLVTLKCPHTHCANNDTVSMKQTMAVINRFKTLTIDVTARNSFADLTQSKLYKLQREISKPVDCLKRFCALSCPNSLLLAAHINIVILIVLELNIFYSKFKNWTSPLFRKAAFKSGKLSNLHNWRMLCTCKLECTGIQ